MSTQRLIYRPEIDGLRAIAVLSVFTFHLNHSWLPGGFVGVDIFFVISGYLITSILYNECLTGHFSLTRFYQRRISRIFPAFFFVALATILGTTYVYTAQDFASAGANLAAASFSIANLKYMFQGNYFEISPDAQPFLHYWSLSVEEQFYVIFPSVLFLLFRYARPYLTAILTALCLGSLIACVLITERNPVGAFYLLPTRMWELCIGSILAIVPLYKHGKNSITLRPWLPLIGTLLIGSSITGIQEGPNFPGWQAIFPVVGAAMIILPTSNESGWIKQRLSSPVLVSIGKISYSLYLWHWPVFSLVDYQFYLLSDGFRFVLKVGLSFFFTFITYRFIETPTRLFLNQPRNRVIAYASLVAALTLCITVGLYIRNENYINASFTDVERGGVRFSNPPNLTSAVLIGDSNGSMYGKVIRDICADTGTHFTLLSVAAGDPLPRQKSDSDKLWKNALEAVRKAKPDYVVLAAHWTEKLHDDRERLTIAIDEIRPYAKHIFLLNQPPILPRGLNRAALRAGQRPPFFEEKSTQKVRRSINQFLREFESQGVTVIDVSKKFETAAGAILFLDEDGRQLYQDATHLSGYGAAKIDEMLRQALSRAESIH